MDAPTVEDLWEREAFSESGERLGRIEAVGMGRGRVPRRVGVRSEAGGPALRFFSLTGARLDGARVVLVTLRPLEVLPGGSR
jgi:hypothetical protein